jgi:hypothetical protein
MADSEKTLEPKTSEEIIIRRDTPTKVVRGERGKFKKQTKTMPKTQDVTRLLRNLLNQSEVGPDGVMRKGDKTRIRKMFDNVVAIACMPAESPVTDKFGNVVFKEDGTPYTFKDPKVAMAAVQAFDKLTLRTYGAYNKSDEELDALKTSGVKFVVIPFPAEMMNKEIVPDLPKPALKPAFIEGEFTDGSDAKKKDN